MWSCPHIPQTAMTTRELRLTSSLRAWPSNSPFISTTEQPISAGSSILVPPSSYLLTSTRYSLTHLLEAPTLLWSEGHSTLFQTEMLVFVSCLTLFSIHLNRSWRCLELSQICQRLKSTKTWDPLHFLCRVSVNKDPQQNINRILHAFENQCIWVIF